MNTVHGIHTALLLVWYFSPHIYPTLFNRQYFFIKKKLHCVCCLVVRVSVADVFCGFVFQSWIRRTAVGRCLFPAAHRTRPSSTAPSAHPTASAHPQQPRLHSHPAPLWGPQQTTAQKRKSRRKWAGLLPLTPNLQEADQASGWSLWFLAAMRGIRNVPWNIPVLSPLCIHLSSF